VLDQAQVVRQIFEWVGQDRVSINEVAHRLTLRQVPTPKGGPRWSRQSVYGILKNPAYTGLAAFGRRRYGERRPRLRAPRGRPESPRRPVSLYHTERMEQISVAVPALVSPDLFQIVQEQLQENRQRRRVASGGARHLLQGLLVCSCCGYSYYGRRVTATRGRAQRTNYICPGTEPYRNGGQRICSNPAVRGDQLDTAVWEDVRSLLHDPQRLLAEYQRRITGDPDDESRVEGAQRMHRAQRQLDRLIDAYAAELVTKEEFESRSRGLRTRLAEHAKEQETIAAELNERATFRQVIGDFQEFSQRMEQGLSAPTWETRRQILCTLVKRVEIGPEQVRVVYRVNPHPFVLAPSRGPKQDCLWRQNASARSGLIVPRLRFV
jgi:site-specific DNA recombinase